MKERVAVSTVEEAVEAARASGAESVLLLFADDLAPLTATLLRAAIGPLAVERAPARVNALVVGTGADPADVEETARFLENARSTTGQLLEVLPR